MYLISVLPKWLWTTTKYKSRVITSSKYFIKTDEIKNARKTNMAMNTCENTCCQATYRNPHQL